MSSLLPPNSGALLRNIATACADGTALPVPIRELYDPDTCPVALLPWLAWAWSVDEWDSAWPEYRQRQAVNDALELHRRKGTVWAVKRVIENQGWILAALIEGVTLRLNGTSRLNGWYLLGAYHAWASYRIVLHARGVQPHEKASLRRALSAVAPARCQLIGIHYLPLPLVINGTCRLDGDYNLGAPYV